MKYILLLLTSCSTLTPKTKGPIFLHQRIPPELCKGGVEHYGLYRVLKDGRIQELSYCDPRILQYFGIHSVDLEM